MGPSAGLRHGVEGGQPSPCTHSLQQPGLAEVPDGVAVPRAAEQAQPQHQPEPLLWWGLPIGASAVRSLGGEGHIPTVDSPGRPDNTGPDGGFAVSWQAHTTRRKRWPTIAREKNNV